MNYKIGDKVRIMSEKTGSRWNCDGEMDKWLGKTMTIKKIVPLFQTTHCKMEEDAGERCGIGWKWFPEMIAEFAREPRHSIHITCTDGKTTHAVKKVDGKIVARSKAVCCPTDEFNANIGAQLAFNRLVYGTDYHPSEAALKPEQPKREDKHTYKAGDKVKVINNTCGHFAKIGGVITLSDNDVWCKENAWHYREHFGYITECDFEPYTEPEKAEPEYLNMRVVCVAGSSGFTVGKVYEFKSGVVADDDGDVLPSNGDEKITSLSDAYLRYWENKFIEFKGE